jgi:hypothetical protein
MASRCVRAGRCRTESRSLVRLPRLGSRSNPGNTTHAQRDGGESRLAASADSPHLLVTDLRDVCDRAQRDPEAPGAADLLAEIGRCCAGPPCALAELVEHLGVPPGTSAVGGCAVAALSQIETASPVTTRVAGRRRSLIAGLLVVAAFALGVGVPAASAAQSQTITLSVAGGQCSKTSTYYLCTTSTTAYSSGTFAAQFDVAGATSWWVAMDCTSATNVSSVALPDVWGAYPLLSSTTATEDVYAGLLQNNGTGPGGSGAGPYNAGGFVYLGSLQKSGWDGEPVEIEGSFTGANSCLFRGYFFLGAGEAGNLATLVNSPPDHSDLAQLHSDLGGTLATSCALCAKDSTLSAFAATTHTDLGAIAPTAPTTDVTDRLDLTWWGVWIVAGLLTMLLVQPYWDRLFSWWRNAA